VAANGLGPARRNHAPDGTGFAGARLATRTINMWVDSTIFAVYEATAAANRWDDNVDDSRVRVLVYADDRRLQVRSSNSFRGIDGNCSTGLTCL